MLVHLAAHPKLRLACVSGRDKNLIEQAIKNYELPEADFVIGDIGSTMYRIVGGRWLANSAWEKEIGQNWHGNGHDDIVRMVNALEIDGLHLNDLDVLTSGFQAILVKNAADDVRRTALE